MPKKVNCRDYPATPNNSTSEFSETLDRCNTVALTLCVAVYVLLHTTAPCTRVLHGAHFEVALFYRDTFTGSRQPFVCTSLMLSSAYDMDVLNSRKSYSVDYDFVKPG